MQDEDERIREERRARAQAARRNIPAQYSPEAAVLHAQALSSEGSAAQGRHLQGMMGSVNRAIASEMESRVAQGREIRRMEHEKALERERQATERLKAQSLIDRLGQESGRTIHFRGGSITHQ